MDLQSGDSRALSAFPNAYIETDELPGRLPWSRVLGLAGMIGIVYFGLTIAALHLEPTGYDPVRQAVSDYAVGPFGKVMAIGFFVGGLGLVSLSLSLLMSEVASRTFKLGAAFLLIAGLALFSVGSFPTDIEGAVTTFHGTMHSALSQLVFSFGPIGLLLISLSYGKKWFLATLVVYAITGAFLALNLSRAMGMTGLSERFFILFLLSWWFVASYKAFRNRLPVK